MILKSIFIFICKVEECTYRNSCHFKNAISFDLYMDIEIVVTTMFPEIREYKILYIDLLILNTIQREKNRKVTRK